LHQLHEDTDAIDRMCSIWRHQNQANGNMTKKDVLKTIEVIAKTNDWSTRIVVDSAASPLLLLQKELCELIVYSDRDDVLWVCSYPEMDDKFQLDQRGDDWFIVNSLADQVVIMQSLEDQFQAVKRYNEGPTCP
jgi:hypothetical protein